MALCRRRRWEARRGGCRDQPQRLPPLTARAPRARRRRRQKSRQHPRRRLRRSCCRSAHVVWRGRRARAVLTPEVLWQVRSIAWKCMDFRLHVPPATLVSEIKPLILKRHAKASGKDAIERIDFYYDDVVPEKQITDENSTIGSLTFSRKGDTGMSELFYEYYPHGDPFENRPFAAVLNATNPELSLPPSPPSPTGPV